MSKDVESMVDSILSGKSPDSLLLDRPLKEVGSEASDPENAIQSSTEIFSEENRINLCLLRNSTEKF